VTQSKNTLHTEPHLAYLHISTTQQLLVGTYCTIKFTETSVYHQ